LVDINRFRCGLYKIQSCNACQKGGAYAPFRRVCINTNRRVEVFLYPAAGTRRRRGGPAAAPGRRRVRHPRGCAAPSRKHRLPCDRHVRRISVGALCLCQSLVSGYRGHGCPPPRRAWGGGRCARDPAAPPPRGAVDGSRPQCPSNPRVDARKSVEWLLFSVVLAIQPCCPRAAMHCFSNVAAICQTPPRAPGPPRRPPRPRPPRRRRGRVTRGAGAAAAARVHAPAVPVRRPRQRAIRGARPRRRGAAGRGGGSFHSPRRRLFLEVRCLPE